MDWNMILGSGVVLAAVNAIFKLLEKLGDRRRTKKDAAEKENDVECKALCYLMLYIIQKRATEHLITGKITLEERRSLHKWHDLYHKGLGGNGDADALMAQVDALPVDAKGVPPMNMFRQFEQQR